MNDVSLREYIESRLSEQEKRWDDRHRTYDRELLLAKQELDRRLDESNGLRKILDKQNIEQRICMERLSSQFVDVKTYDKKHDELDVKIRDIEDWRNTLLGKQNRSNTISMTAIVLTLVLIVIEIFKFMG